MYFYYKMYTICKLFYNTFTSSQELCILPLTSFTDFSPPAYSMIKPRLFTLNAVFLKYNKFKKEIHINRTSK
ncbi:hypothetical protein INE89_02160 [Bacteroides thetaiotaomicron]|nr:hypothetical protein INE89_02160 [Bacteroides thetaiotaomicron]